MIKDTRRTVRKPFRSGKLIVEDVPFLVSDGIDNPTEYDLVVTGPVMLKLIGLFNYMKQKDLLVLDYNTELE